MSDARERIIEATIQVIAREGLVGTSTRKIAAEAGVNLAMLHYYFGNKDDLLVAVHQTILQTVRATVADVAPIQPGDDLRSVVTRELTAFWQYVEKTPTAQIVQYELALHALRDPQAHMRARQESGTYNALVAERCQQIFEATRQPCVLPLADLARFIIAGIDGLTLQFLADRDTERARHDLQLLISATLALVAACPSPTP